MQLRSLLNKASNIAISEGRGRGEGRAEGRGLQGHGRDNRSDARTDPRGDGLVPSRKESDPVMSPIGTHSNANANANSGVAHPHNTSSSAFHGRGEGRGVFGDDIVCALSIRYIDLIRVRLVFRISSLIFHFSRSFQEEEGLLTRKAKGGTPTPIPDGVPIGVRPDRALPPRHPLEYPSLNLWLSKSSL